MAASQSFTYASESQSLPPINTQQSLSLQPPPPFSDHGFPMLAVAVLGISATAFLLISYYIFVTKCCFRWQLVDPLRRFSTRRAQLNEDPLTSYSPSWQSRGLNELLIREIPTFQYNKHVGEGGSSRLSKCVVCLNEFQDHDMLRVLPKCGHAFHLDCIDVWLLSNSNCPLCRSTISGRNRYWLDRIVAPNSSPQEPMVGSIFGGGEDFVEIEIRGEDGTGMPINSRRYKIGDSSRFLVQSTSHSSRKFAHKTGNSKPRKFHHVSIMGDEGINVREQDDQFSIQPIRRSFSMDSAADRHVYLSVQDILQQNRQLSEVRNNEESSSRSRRSIFSFGHGRGSRTAVLPIEF